MIRVGNNLTINPSTGILSSIASGSGRIKQLVITVSPFLGAADYQSINVAISNAIGTRLVYIKMVQLLVLLTLRHLLLTHLLFKLHQVNIVNH